VRLMDLNGVWQLGESAPGAGDAQGWQRTGVPAEHAIPAQVPGDVHLDLLHAGRINEPLFGKNALDCRWVEARDWWYSRTVTIDGPFLSDADRIELHAAGLDLTAEMWLNGQSIGGHNNQFIPATFDVTDILRPGDNLLVARLDVGLRSAPNDRQRYVHISGLPACGLPRMWMRKAQFSFGWDWAPRLLTCGIWRPIALRAYQRLAVRDVFLAPHLDAEVARIRIQAEIESFAKDEFEVHLFLKLQGRQVYPHELEVTLGPGTNLIETEIVVPDPILWWPQPLGEPFLYDFVLEASEAGRTLDRYETQCGIREISLAQEPLAGDEGTSFAIQINGQPVFCKGANWAPADSIPSRVGSEKYQALIAAAAEANFNMLRIWGGGIYEDPYFYQLCDQAGIMIWQDFLFACSLYPDDDPGFCDEVRREAEVAVRELRNHPCLVLWCGNNENDWIYARRVDAGWDLPVFYGGKVYHEILPEVCARLDPIRPYWPSSPYGGDDPNSESLGDRHHWDVPINLKDAVERVDFRRWGMDRGKFISEYGMLSPPVEDSLRRFLPPDELYIGSPGWSFHNNLFEKDNLATCLRRYWREPETLSLEEYVLVTQIIQAEAMKYSLEHFRHRKFATSGALFWAYSDCWGAIGWSVIDYYLRKKPAFYYVRRALAPLMVSFHEEDGLALWLTNDTLESHDCLVQYGVFKLDDSSSQVTTLETNSSANSAHLVTEVDVPDTVYQRPGDFLLFARLLVDGRVVGRNRRFMTGFMFRDVHLPPVEIEHTLEQVGDQEFLFHLDASAFAWGVGIQIPPSVWVEDNYFDLLPGEGRDILLRGSVADVSKLKVGCINAFR
jgi:beta-mannosidase